MIFKRKNQKRSEKSSHSIWTKTVALTLALSITAGFMSETPLAAVGNDDEQYSGSVSIGDDMKVSGTNAFGSMVAGALSEKSSEQTKNNGYNVFSVEVEGTTAAVSFETREESTLVVGIYDEEGEELLAVGTAEVTKGETETKVVIAADKMPAYFYIKAYLVEKYTQRPLCTEYTSPMYTKKMQEFLAKTTDDFEPERVVNFDGDKKTNFAVFADDIKLLHDDEAANIPVSVDEEAREYVFENVDEDITSLKQGDIFVHENNGELLIIKVSSITVDKTAATIKGGEMELTEVFEHLRIDADTDPEDAVVDTSNLGEGVIYEGRVGDKNDNGVVSYATNDEGKDEKADLFKIKNSMVDVSAYLKFTTATKLYVDWFDIYVELSVEYSANLEVTILGTNVNGTFPFAPLTFIPFPGVILSVTPSFVVEVDAKLTIKGTLSGSIGMKADNNGITDISRSPEFKLEGECSVTIFIGISLEPKVTLIHEWIATASLTAKAGVEITASLKVSTEEKKFRHDCGDENCVAGDVAVKFSASAEAKLLNCDWMHFKLDILEIKLPLFVFYYSFKYNEFGFSECPHKSYEVTANIVDGLHKPIKGAKVVPGSGADPAYTDAKGNAVFYLKPGSYTLSAMADGYEYDEVFIILGEAKRSVTIKLREIEEQEDLEEIMEPMLDNAREGSSDPEDPDYEVWDDDKDDEDDDEDEEPKDIGVEYVSLGVWCTAAITEDGSLYMWGSNSSSQLGNGTRKNSSSPVKILDNAAYVSLGGYNHSAAITTDGSLYMWGNGSYGKLGNGENKDSSTPVKIMDNVAYVSLGTVNSAAITTDGSLYMWGSNQFGMLGDGTTENRSVPVKIMDNVAYVTVEGDHTAAITKDGGLYTWGSNNDEHLGTGSNEVNNPTPVKILDNVASVSFGVSHAAAVTTSGSLYLWGSNFSGEIGNGTYGSVETPVKVMDKVAQVSLGSNHSAAITTSGSLYMWGDNYFGQLGNGSAGDVTKPVKIMDNVADVTLGNQSTVVITKDGSLYTWGRNDFGELGNGKVEEKSAPAKIMDNVAYVCHGDSHSAAITTDGSLYTWGLNEYGQLGNGAALNEYGYIESDAEGYIVPTPAKVTLSSAASKTATVSTCFLSQPQVLSAPAAKTFTGLLPNETYNYYSVKSRTVKNVMSSDNLLYIGQTVSDAKGTLTVPDYVPDGVIYVKAMKSFTVRNADITKAETDGSSVSLAWDPIENAGGYEVIGISNDGISVREKTTDTSIVMNDLTTGEVYGFIVTSIVYGEQSVPAVGDAVVIRLQSFILGDVNGSGGEPNNDDLIILAQYLANWDVEINLKAANVDGDPNGNINNDDLIRLAQILAGWKF